MLKHVRLTGHTDGTSTILLDDSDVSGIVTDAAVRCRSGALPQVDLNLLAAVSCDLQGEVHLHLPGDVERALIAAGWTRPEASK